MEIFNKKISAFWLIVICVLGFASAGLGYAVYTMSSNHIQGTPKAAFVLVANVTTGAGGISFNSNATVGDTIHLVASASDTVGSAGLTVTFLNNGTSIGTAVASIAGVATYDYINITGPYDLSVTATHN